MLFDPKNVFPITVHGKKISLFHLERALKKAGVVTELWPQYPSAKSVPHLRANLLSGRTQLFRYDLSLVLVERILVLDVRHLVAINRTEHLFELVRDSHHDAASPGNVEHLLHNNVAMRMRHDEKLADALKRCVGQKLPFIGATDLLLDSPEPREQESIVCMSKRYPGIREVQRPFFFSGILLDEQYHQTYIVTRKKRGRPVRSIYAWREHEPDLSKPMVITLT